MATSPVPDMAAPPGMCPGVAVMGGGGAGGDGDGDGSGGKDGAGGNANGDGENGNGNGKKGNGCGKGGAGGCPTCGHKVAGGDPVAIATGEMFTIANEDLRSPGFVDIIFLRRYTTLRCARDVGIGYGWTHTFAWHFERTRKAILLEKGGGARQVAMDLPTPEAPTTFGDWHLSVSGDDYVLDTGDDFSHVFSALGPRGADYRLTRVRHVKGHGFYLEYDGAGRLSTIIDSAGRRILVGSTREGRIASLSITEPTTGFAIVFSRYEYDESGNLVRFTNADGFVHAFAYDEEHRMVRQSYPDGPTFHYVYDTAGRCVETWGEPAEGTETALAPDLPDTLADGKTRAKGFAHIRIDFLENGYVEYFDSVSLHRFFTDDTGSIVKAVVCDSVTEHAIDARGSVAARIGPTGATATFKYDECGRLIEETDALGRTVRVERDAQGRVVRNVDLAGREISCVRDQRGNIIALTNQRGATTTYDLDEHGQIVRATNAIGGVTRYIGDGVGFLRSLVQPNGAHWRFEYDYFGRMVQRTDPLGRVVSFGYSPSGRMIHARQGDFAIAYTYNGLGCVTQVSAPEGTYQIRWGGFRWPYERVEPNGDRIRAQYNREGWPVGHFNQAGELYSFAYDKHGMCVHRTQFHGATLDNKYDAAHQRVRFVTTTDDVAEFERDVAGRELRRVYSDGRAFAFEYDRAWGIRCARAAEGTFHFEYDEVGNVVEERQEVDGVLHWARAKYDLENHLIELSTSLGHTVHIRRTADGERQAALLDGDTAVNYERNPLGLETALCLPGGGRVETDYDERYRISRRRVLVARTVDQSVPQWVGIDPRVVAERSYHFSASNTLADVKDLRQGKTKYTYDARRRLVGREAEGGTPEFFTCDPTGNVYERGAGAVTRDYGRGNLLLRRGDTHYSYDAEGRLVRKEVRRDGQAVRAWRYEWNAQDHLVAVEAPDGRRVSFTYDPFARRLTKTVSRRDELGAHRVLTRVRYVWFGRSLIHAITTKPNSPQVVRTYAYTDRAYQPFAHRDTSVGEAPGDWVFYVGDILNTPERLVRGDGRIVGELTRSAYGVTRSVAGSSATTDVRFPGQLQDEETGLHYNLHRYYDPEAGRYISPDPLGLEPSENLFLYSEADPIGFADPSGLAGHGVKCEVDINQGEDKGTWVPYSDPATRNNPEPGVLKSGWREDKADVPIPGAANKGTGEVKNYDGSHGPTGNVGRDKCHTEQHATEWADKNFGGDCKGSHMRLEAPPPGGLPPCQACNDKMHAFAKKHDATVDYSYPQNNKLQYKGAGGPSVLSKDDDRTSNLANAYQKRNAIGDQTGAPKGGQHEYLVAKGTRSE